MRDDSRITFSPEETGVFSDAPEDYGVQEVAGSNPVAPTFQAFPHLNWGKAFFVPEVLGRIGVGLHALRRGLRS